MTRFLQLLLLALVTGVFAQSDVVQTTKGPIRGIVDTRNQFRSFRGIPYAQSTAGEARWTRPKEMQPWSTVYDATYTRPACPQRQNPRFPVQDEDCLFVNVWTPLKAGSSDDLLPVMVWVHGGGFTSGTGSDTMFSGNYFSNTSNIVLVTINYRLGALGFLNIFVNNTNVLEGNYGFRDQQAALRWVQQNIKAFGGDPSRVTLFGQSAGAMSVTLHLLSPDSAGLFQRVIIQSNPAAMLYRTPHENLEYAARFAEHVKCAVNDTACLKKVPVDVIIEQEIFPEIIIRIPLGTRMVLPWAPAVDGNLIPQQPLDMFRMGKFQRVPIVLGNVKNETGMQFVMTKVMYETFVASIFSTNASKVLQAYPPAGLASGTQAFRVLTDYLFVCPVRYLASLIQKQAGAVSYVYEFVHGPRTDPLSPNPPCNHEQMACHSAELPFVFNTETFYNASFTQEEQALSIAMNGYWSSFANGKMTQEGGLVSGVESSSSEPQWPTWDSKTKPYLSLDVPQRSVSAGFRDSVCNFWDAFGYTI
jgi:acetylcholinesterase/cholinesterase